MARNFGWLFLLILFLASCSLSKFGWQEGPEPKDKGEKAETVAYQEDFDPLALNDDDIKVVPLAKPGAADASQTKAVVVPKTEKAEGEGETVQGFRVQLIATTDENVAREVKKEAMLKLSNKVYLVFEAPHYKIRVGDCQSREEARAILQDATANGFPDAWIVPSMVHPKDSAESGE